MMGKELDALTRRYPETVIIRLAGGFYNAFEDSARVLSAVMDYKIKKVSPRAMPKCGFPASDSALDKVINTLEQREISYAVLQSGEEIAGMDFPGNKFREVLDGFNDLYIELPFENEPSERDVNGTRRADGLKRLTLYCDDTTYNALTALAEESGITRELGKTEALRRVAAEAMEEGLKAILGEQ